MSTKAVVLTVEDDKQLGCMNGLFKIFDRRLLLGQRRHGQNQKRLPPGQSNNGEKEIKNPSEQAKVKAPKVVMKDENRVSVELPRNSFFPTSSSTATSSLFCSKKIQKSLSSSSESVVFEPSPSPFLPKKQPGLFTPSPDIRDVVKDSMTREPRVVTIKKVAQEERVGPAMKHIDSPRPFPHQKLVQYDEKDRNDRNLTKVREIQWGAKKIKDIQRFSCDGRESRYQLKSNMKIRELPRLSLDSRQGCRNSSTDDPLNIRRSSSSVVARLMGLEALTTTIDENQTMKAKSEESVLTLTPRKDEKIKRDCSRVITRIPLETAPWKQEGGGLGPQKPPAKTDMASRSIYGEIEKRLTEHEYKTTGKDLRALKQILEAMQKTKSKLENKEIDFDDITIDDKQSQKSDQPVSPIVNVISPRKVKHSVSRNRFKETNPKERKTTSRPRSTSSFSEHSGSVSPRLQRSKPKIIVQSSDLSRPKKQPSIQRTQFGSTTRTQKAKPVDPLRDSIEKRISSQQIHIEERLIEEKSTVDQAKHTTEQPSPVSVLDAFYTEDAPSPVKKKSSAFSDDEKLHFEEAHNQYSEFNSLKLESIKHLVQQIELLNTNIEDFTVDQLKISHFESEIEDDRYVEDILTASGCLKDLNRTTNIVQIHPTGGLINPELFHVLEKAKGYTDIEYNKKNMSSKLRRKLVFDTVNDFLGQKLATLGPFGPRKGGILNGEKLMKEMCSEIKCLQNNSEICVCDEDDEVLNIINEDVNKRSQDWDEYYYQVPGIVLDIECMIFRDLVDEVVNGQVTDLQDWPARRHCRQLFPM
ncbi:protein LONGIFOLIA 1-like [Rutidosis leptorrhynchoides]|uniref:protein LONGIFOLIA 1-like n=1 Tax=Rutidosis leptorrhynchoides TaxID=125765 RepID=UPI003A99770B